MVKRIAIAIGYIFALLFVGILMLILVVGTLSEGSATCTLKSGRAVIASAHLFIGVESSKDTATVRTARHTIIISPTSATVDGRPVGQFSSDAKEVNVRVTWTEIQILVDGKLIGGQGAAIASKALPTVR